jgi:serine/threonine protein kinase
MLVDGTLDSSGEQAVQMHLDSCVDCRRELNGMVTADVALKDAACCLLDDELDSEVRAIGRSEIEESANQVDEPSESSTTAALDRLAPSDHPTMLGRVGGYEVSGVVGAGAMGVVLKAFDQSLDRAVAIKVLAPHLATSGAARKRFAREAKAAAAVLHPNVMAIHSVSNEESLPYLVMPYLRGTSLQKRLDNEGQLPVSEILRIGAQIAAGLAAAHAQGLVHRDIKPANILLEAGVERVAITDFGLARAVDDATMTRTGVIAGTPQYMSPEQSRGELVDQRSDLFSLGSVLYTMCTGRAPFRAETSYGILRRITDTEPRSIGEINPDIPEWLCQIIAKLMSKQPADRFAAASEVAELLEECLAHVQQPATVPLPEGCLSLHKPDQPLGTRASCTLV